MTFAGWFTIIAFVLVLSVLAFPLGTYIARVYTGERVFLTPIFGWPERFLYKVLRVDHERQQDWKAYAKSLIVFSLAGWIFLYVVLRTQDAFFVPHSLNPLAYHSAPANVVFNITSSFMTNTNWQFYSGETTMSYLSQMIGLTVQNWLSAGVGIVVAVALVRGIISRSGKGLGNFWQDMVRTILYVLAPLSVLVAIVLASQGVIANFSTYLHVHTITGLTQTIAMGPVADQHSIMLLGTNGGGFFNTNAAHPFENPSQFTNFFEMLAVLIIPAALIFMYGRMTGNRRQGYAIYATVMVMFLGACIVAYIAEAHGSPAQHAAGLHTGVISGSGGGNLEGKEQRFGIAGSAIFDVVTTVTSCGAVNSALESFTGIGGAVPFANLSAGVVLDPPVRAAGGLHRRADGRTHARVARQEARGERDKARRPRDPDHAPRGAVLHGTRRRDKSGKIVDQRSGDFGEARRAHAPGVLRELLRVSLSGEQQRLRFRRIHRLDPAERRQPRRPRHQLRRRARRLRHGLRALRADPVRAGRRGRARRQADHSRGPRHDAHRQPHVRGAVDRRDHPRRRADVLPRPAARTDRPGPDRTPLLT
jgi:hypothetical protein